ncbi:MAG TPA: hypothetical protein VJT32_08080 [bacterium]|nr:hypothetical protein [bacterium]
MTTNNASNPTMYELTLEIIAAMSRAHDAGRAWANGLRVGDRFLGAGPAADEQGFSDACLRSIFIQAALVILERKVVMTSMDGILVEYRDIPRQEVK